MEGLPQAVFLHNRFSRRPIPPTLLPQPFPYHFCFPFSPEEFTLFSPYLSSYIAISLATRASVSHFLSDPLSPQHPPFWFSCTGCIAHFFPRYSYRYFLRCYYQSSRCFTPPLFYGFSRLFFQEEGGGCILITFMSSDIPRQIYCHRTHGSREDSTAVLAPFPGSWIVFFCAFPPFIWIYCHLLFEGLYLGVNLWRIYWRWVCRIAMIYVVMIVEVIL